MPSIGKSVAVGGETPTLHPFYLDFGMAFEKQMLELGEKKRMLSFLQNRELIFELPVEHLFHGNETNQMAGQPNSLPLLAIQELLPGPTMNKSPVTFMN